MKVKVTYQPETDSFYFYLREGEESVRQEEVAPETVLDFDAEGNLIGVEVYGDGARRVDLSSIGVERYADATGIGASLRIETGFLAEVRKAKN